MTKSRRIDYCLEADWAALAIAAVILATPAVAQELCDRVQRVVTDVSGAVIPAASVTLHNVNICTAMAPLAGCPYSASIAGT